MASLMTNAITQLKLWYNKLNAVERVKFKECVMERCGIFERTFYTHLNRQPPKLVKEVISELSGIPVNDLYKTI